MNAEPSVCARVAMASRSTYRTFLARGLTVSLPLTLLGGCEWFTDFKRQPYVATWESLRTDSAVVRGNPQMSVPITGRTVPGFAVSYAPMPATVDSMSGLANPTAPDEASLLNGRKYYSINCAVCHGDTGQGNGTATGFGMVPIPLNNASAMGRSDGYIFGIIRNGRGLMPSYNRIEEADRWDVVNYVRSLQGRLGAPAQTGPLAAPGLTGSALPGPTRLGPTRPVPYMPRPAAPADSAVARPAGGAAGDTTRRAPGDTTRAGTRPPPREEERS